MGACSILLLWSTVACIAAPQEGARDVAAADAGPAVPGSDGDFDWERSSGGTILVPLDQQPYTEAILKCIPEFEKKTGIRVRYSVTPESNYFDKLKVSLNARNGHPNVFMTVSYQL